MHVPSERKVSHRFHAEAGVGFDGADLPEGAFNMNTLLAEVHVMRPLALVVY